MLPHLAQSTGNISHVNWGAPDTWHCCCHGSPSWTTDRTHGLCAAPALSPTEPATPKAAMTCLVLFVLRRAISSELMWKNLLPNNKKWQRRGGFFFFPPSSFLGSSLPLEVQTDKKMEKEFLCTGPWCEPYTMCQRCSTAPPSGNLFCWRRPGNLDILFILWALQAYTSVNIQLFFSSRYFGGYLWWESLPPIFSGRRAKKETNKYWRKTSGGSLSGVFIPLAALWLEEQGSLCGEIRHKKSFQEHQPLALVTSWGLLLRVYKEQAKLQAIDEAFGV